jgi:hypothetical protein
MVKPMHSLLEGRPALILLDHPAQRQELSSLSDCAQASDIPVIWAFADSRHGAMGTADDAPVRIRPRRLSIFFGTELTILLRELAVRTLILAGGETSVRVHYSFVDAHQNDYHTRVVEDCMSGSSPRAHEAALCAMEYMQSGARQRRAAISAAFSAYRHTAAARS